MNEIVVKFIKEQNEKLRQEKQKEKDKHLLELGLIDENLSEKQYAGASTTEGDAKVWGYKHHDSKGYFKIIKGVPLNVTDEEYEEICKVSPPTKTIPDDKFQVELLEKTDSIRKMVKFFVILTVISMVCGFILALVALSKGSTYSYY
jgi:hypothetical protein